MPITQNQDSTSIIPPDEMERVRDLRELTILDTDPEIDFDRITRLAKILFQTRFCAISLIDEHRQWFKSMAGFNIEECPRDIAFCSHTILTEEPFIVRDTTADPLFKDNPLVTGEPGIRFYAGVPLNTREGSKVGAICVFDTTPRPDWSPLRTAMLKEMAAWVCHEIESRSRKMQMTALLSAVRATQIISK